MDTTAVNWEALDALVVDFAKSERLIDDSSSESSSSHRWRILIGQIRRSIMSGDIDSAIDLLRARAPAVLDDHRLLFRLQKQKFIELLRKRTTEDRESAMKYARTSLAPCAMEAYPEAYEEFKHVLLAFIYDEDEMSPVVNEWSERRRFEIAGLLSSVLRAHLHAYDPIFSLTLRYLISIHKGYFLHQGVPSPIADLTERLLLEERDPPAPPQEGLIEAPPFDEVDIQALAQAVELTRQGAIDSLKFAKGDLNQAFQNELCRMRLDISLLDELVHEYCVYRGIIDSGSINSVAELHAGSGMKNVDKWVPGSSLSENCSIGTGSDISITSIHMEGSQGKTDPVRKQTSDVEVRYPCEITSPSEDCSTSRIHQHHDNKPLRRNRTLGTGERGKRKRWRGRNESLDIASEVLSGSGEHELGVDLLGSRNMDIEKHSLMYNISNIADKYEVVLGMKELASEGMAAEVIDEINALDPDFFSQNPTLLFQLKQVEFFKLIRAGDHSSALKVASSHLGPLAAKYPALLEPLKETTMALLRSSEEPSGKQLPLDAVATSLQVAFGRRLGIEEPKLMKIIRTTLYTHGEWFKLQMCKDQFEGLLWINSLKGLGRPFLADAESKSTNDTCIQGSSPGTIFSSNTRMVEDGSGPNQISSSDIGCDENAILKVMEFLALPRGDAIHLLAQYNWNAETLIQQIFA